MFGRPQQHSQINTLLRTLYKEQFQNQLHKFHHVYNPDSVQVDSAQLQSPTRQLHQFQNSMPPLLLHTNKPDSVQVYSGGIQSPTHQLHQIQNSLPPLPLHTYGSDSNQIYSGQVQLPTHPDNSTASKRVPSFRRKKGCAWTTEEHRLFLLGLEQYGKGDWKSIARYCVVSKTPSQIASHAQKYFLRNKPLKQKKRASIHDITLESEHLVKVEVDHQQQSPEPEPEPENPIQELNHDDSIPHHVDQQHNTIQQLHNDSVPHQVDQQQNTIQQPQINWEDYINLPMQDLLEWPILLDQLELYEQNNCYVPEDPFNSQMQQASDSETLQFNPPDNVNIPPYLMDDFDPFDKSIKPAC